MENLPKDLSLYLVTDERMDFTLQLKKIEEAIKGGVTMVQLREKKIDGGEFLKRAKQLKKLTSSYNVPFVINDRIDIALAVEADGIHIGQTDIPLSDAKKMVPKTMFIGVSVKTMDQAKEAEQEGADYVGIGSVFPTETKEDAERITLDLLGNITSSISIPSVAIGGINQNNIEQLTKSKIDGVAVVSSILSAKDSKKALNNFQYLNKNLNELSQH
ncbi:thiamine phosphate synthase [Bacillus carboniphilus]|uniref:Thiamine-phosphate synthase n=1 Tax=Bacillus carboniphilus TaxID=86663 RepID=A0ABY9JPP6_9BACI|nr:thiamine phosphate synthase [Bacillus carboniphilus]WLR41377.1 thiamine phosphate synthase [Bacillus carboniphilus]